MRLKQPFSTDHCHEQTISVADFNLSDDRWVRRGGSSSDGGDSSVYGLWDSNRDVSDPTDVAYLHLSRDELTYFDYQGDTFDAGDNCYLVFRSMVVSLGGA